MTFLFVYLGMSALGLSLEAMITVLTPKFIPFFLFILVSVLSLISPCLSCNGADINCAGVDHL
jgi:hypothetical protein